MKRILITICLVVATLMASAEITFSFSPRSITAGALKTKMERSITALLNELNSAGQTGRDLDLSLIDIETGAVEHLNAQWEVLPFVCDDMSLVSNCLNDHQGYQVRGINITLRPRDSSYTQNVKRQLTISLNRNGRITGVRPTLENHEDFNKIVTEGQDVEDLTRRREILKWVEDFRNYYNERNLKALNQIYSDDALIITGSIVKPRKSNDYNDQLNGNVKYKVQSKSEYIANLNNIFNRVRMLDVKFDHISVVRDGSHPHIYGVTLHQTWRTSGYSDEGWLFLVWDFADRDHPQIHVRTWQPDQLVKQTGVFALNDFFIP